MKAGKIVLALALAAGAVAAYWYFPDPLGDQLAAAGRQAAEEPSARTTPAGPDATPAPAPAPAQ